MSQTINIILGYACNASCSFCSQRDEPKIPTDSAKIIASLETILKQSPNTQTVNILGGEPLLYPQLLETCISTVRKHSNAGVSIATNGILWDMSLTAWANTNEICVDISIDGITEGEKPLCNLDYKALKQINKLQIITVITEHNTMWADTLAAAALAFECNIAAMLDSTNTQALMTKEVIYHISKSKAFFKSKGYAFVIKNMFSKVCDCNKQIYLLPNGNIENIKEHSKLDNLVLYDGCVLMYRLIPEYYPILKGLFN